ncbi:MAG: bifunctional DNA-formamidopyrimidine glycosylase/DNA-(apurinic or apyrimidinic site) lyase [Bdellovibrionaceae bacterium]|nr:bifunctional DNA-formamidopyrimidine glycosylase/DNA-(apurinic or apyrimidinic site) lyase [Pseudobdellovibrionaceae bacterium]NUM58226.1 bifunctional DNA-formamidopyrimidine glycosylase/DNA-(apurinic or apyrimidinic site) lyase [Pseudobdellovibrionaceae bacterium]
MPELPEVEIVKLNLEQALEPGDEVENIEFLSSKLRTQLCLPKDIRWPLSINKLERRSKYILLHFSGGFLLSHLGMTGSWRVEKKIKAQKHDHVIIRWKKGNFWIYNDPRRFGVFEFGVNTLTNKWLAKLGPEPLDKDFDTAAFLQSLKSSQRSIKVLLMDAKVIVGVGNIYACEALFRAKINPFVKARGLSSKKLELLLSSVKDILQTAIKKGGSTIDSFKNVSGEKGAYQKQHLVYGREGEKCVICSQVIRRKVQVGRSTFWCPRCQK